jgi:hypothetical protein
LGGHLSSQYIRKYMEIAYKSIKLSSLHLAIGEDQP